MPALLEHLQRALVRLSRQSLTLALLVTEVKEINELGASDATKDAGQALVREVAHRLTTAIRAGDIAGRIGPGTFALLCEDLGSLDEAIQIARRVIDDLDEPFELDDRTVTIKAHLGLGFPVGEDRADELMFRSFEALHAARVNPRSRFDVILGHRDSPRNPY